jgi:hypothetical protein
MSFGQSSITSFFRKNLNPSIPNSATSQHDEKSANSPQPKQSPSATASGAATPAMDKPRDKKLRNLPLDSSKMIATDVVFSGEKCEDITPPKGKISDQPPGSGVSKSRNNSNQNKKMRGEKKINSGHDTPDRFLETIKSDQMSEPRSCRRATRLVGSMREESSESEGDLQSLGSDDDITQKSRAARTAKSSSGRCRTKTGAATKIPKASVDSSSLVGEVDHLRYKKLDVDTSKSSFQQDKSKSRVLVRTTKCESKNSEESPVLQRMREFKENSDRKAETELWTALSQVEEEMEDDSKSSKLESMATSTTNKANKESDQAESTYELERLENIRCDDTWIILLSQERRI